MPVKYLDEYRDTEAARKLASAIAATVTRPWVIMEVCGGQTHTIACAAYCAYGRHLEPCRSHQRELVQIGGTL
jgi:hypothetical protein